MLNLLKMMTKISQAGVPRGMHVLLNHLTANGLNTLFMLSAAALTHTNIH